jgi:chemosensory pili system protein ChpA (sensor histidine kinase/response regulator)
MSSEFDRQSLVGVFVREASDGLDALSKALHPPDGTIPPPQELTDQYIIAHRICGAAALYGFSGVAQLAEHLEMLLEHPPSLSQTHWDQTVASMRNITQTIQGIVRAIGQGDPEDAEAIARCWASIPHQREEEKPANTAAAPSPEPMVTENYVLPQLDAEILSCFIPEAEGYLGTIDELVRVLGANPDDAESIYQLFRAVHALKGSAYTVGFQVIGDLAHPMEDGMIAVREKRLSLTPDLLDLLAKAADLIRLALRHEPVNIRQLQHDIPRLLNCLVKMVEDTTVSPTPATFSDDNERGGSPSALPETVASGEGRLTDLSEKYVVPDLDPEVLSYFIPEAQGYVEVLETDLLRLDKEPRNKDLIHRLFRTAHTLKGSAYTVGFQAIGDLVHHVEDFMDAVRDGRLSVLPGHTDLMLRAIDVIEALLRRDLVMAEETRQRFDAVRADLKRLGRGTVDETTPVHALEDIARSAISEKSDHDELRGQDDRGPLEKSREGHEVVRVSPVRLDRMMNLVGELVIAHGRLEQRLRILEGLSEQVLAFKRRLADTVQSFADKHMFRYEKAPTRAMEPVSHGFSAYSDFSSLELDKYDDFNILARHIGEIAADIDESMAQLNGAVHKAHDEMSQLQQVALLMRDEVSHTRMVPIGTSFTRFRRAVREIARSLKKDITLMTSGERTEVDAGMVERLVDPLVHLVRNAVYHGIEPAADRIAKGKPAVGTVCLRAAHRGNSVVIEVEDDGAGLDVEKIRAKAIQLGLAPPHQIRAMSDADLGQLIFMPGFSTADTAGDQAGRGVGLDVVKQAVEDMRGHIEVESERGVGTKFIFNLPLTLRITTALLVRVGAEKYAIPLASIQEVTVLGPSSIQDDGDRKRVQIDEQVYELRALSHILHREPHIVDRAVPVVVVRTAGAPMALAVDELLGRQEIVVKPLGTLKPLAQSFFGGATIDPQGQVVLVLDPNRLVPSEAKESVPHVTPFHPPLLQGRLSSRDGRVSTVPHKARLLLIDDSLSIRKFVGRMLESAGYSFDTAVDGEDGLRKASMINYRMILTDLEMPKLNGFEVIQALRSRSETRHTPVVVMTTRARDKHRQMAINLGANSYISKPVEERMLLQEVERWLGKDPATRK